MLAKGYTLDITGQLSLIQIPKLATMLIWSSTRRLVQIRIILPISVMMFMLGQTPRLLKG